MSNISPTNINDGDAVTAASVNNQINTIVNDYNGNITATNLASNSVTTAKITNANVTADKLSTGAATASVTTSETTTSTSFTDLATSGPAVTVTIGANGLALVTVTSHSFNSGANDTFHGFGVSGATTTAASALNSKRTSSTSGFCYSGTFLVTGLAAGSTTFTSKYQVSSGTGTWLNRIISVVPL